MSWVGHAFYIFAISVSLLLIRIQSKEFSAFERKLKSEERNVSPGRSPKDKDQAETSSRSSVVTSQRMEEPMQEFVVFEKIWCSGENHDFVCVSGVNYTKGDFTPYGKVLSVSPKIIAFENRDGYPFFFVNYGGKSVEPVRKGINASNLDTAVGKLY